MHAGGQVVLPSLFYSHMKPLRILLVLVLALMCACKPSEQPSQGGTAPSITAKGLPVFYEANPKLFASTKSLPAIESQLDRIKGMGCDILWLMPIHEFGQKNAVGSPYCIRDYKSVNSSYGTLSDLKSLVQKAHAKDMKVLLDWVANHTSWDHAWITAHPDWYTQEGGVIISPKGMGWNDVADLNYASTPMRSAMKEAMLYWVTEADVDGFRCDYADGVPHDFWKDAISAVKGKKKDAVFLAESSSRSYLSDGFDYIYGWPFKTALKALFGGGSVADFVTAVTAESASLPEGKHIMRFVTNHDQASEQSPVAEYKSAQGLLAATAIMAFCGEAGLVYSSQELGYNSALSFFNVNVLNWNSNPAFTASFEKILSLRQAKASLLAGTPKFYSVGDLVVIYHASGSKGLLVVVNPTGKAVSAKAPMERIGDKVTDLLTGASTMVPTMLEMGAYEYKIYEK